MSEDHRRGLHKLIADRLVCRHCGTTNDRIEDWVFDFEREDDKPIIVAFCSDECSDLRRQKEEAS